MKIITFLNQKGGSGKTTTVLNVGASLAEKGYKVLLIDSDPQGNLTTSTGTTLEPSSITLYEVLRGKATLNDAITIKNNYDLVPTDIRQAGADIELAGIVGRELLIKEALLELKKEYDFILIDCPPSLGIITIMGLTASNFVIVPVQTQFLAMQGLSQLIDTYNLVKKRMNSNLDFLGIVLTMYDTRRSLDSSIVQRINSNFNNKVFKTMINTNVSLAEAPALGMDVIEYAGNSKGAAQYKKLTNEILERIK